MLMVKVLMLDAILYATEPWFGELRKKRLREGMDVAINFAWAATLWPTLFVFQWPWALQHVKLVHDTSDFIVCLR